MNCRLYGNAPYAAAVIHGGPGAPGSVAAVARRLAAAGFGVVEPLQTRNSVAALLEELHETLLRNHADRTALIGHSWGAWLAWMYAAAHPARVSKLILVGSGPFEASYVPAIDAARKRRLTAAQAAEWDAIFAALGDPATPDKDAWMHRLSLLLPDTDSYAPIAIETDAADCIQTDGAALSGIWPEAARMRESGELLALAERIRCPVVAIHGDCDPHPAEGVRLPLAGRLDDFRFHLLPRCGHSPWEERYAMDAFYEIIINELR